MGIKTKDNQQKYTNAEDEWNMNVGWINYLNDLLVLYGECSFNDNYQGMYKCLKLIEHTMSPKVDRDIVETNLYKIKINIRNMIVRGPNGNILKFFPKKIDETIDLLDETYRHIIIKMDAAGVLTRTPKDPHHAFGNFKGS